MKERILTIVFFLTLVLFSGSSYALVLVEPYLGVGGGTLKWNYTVIGSSEAKGEWSLRGGGIGLRVAGEFMYFFGGLDMLINSTTVKKVEPEEGESERDKLFSMGLVVGGELPMIPLRFWVVYNFIDKLGLNDEPKKVLKGKGFKVGVGYKIIPLCSINLEFIRTTYSDLEDDGDSNSLPYDYGTIEYDKASANMIFISGSVPFSF
jgi:hypothetical protein